jgi:hypothetical protein
MYDFQTDGRLQVTAAAALLDVSRLVRWHGVAFLPVNRDDFEASWRKDIDPVFGRLVCWINFSAGAEMFAKGLCLLHECEIRTPQTVPAYPAGNMVDWSVNYVKDWRSRGTTSAINYGTIRHLVDQVNPKTKSAPALRRLFDEVGATSEQRALLLAAYGLLGSAIRNRDAHAYVPSVRDYHVPLVTELFAGCLNTLASWLPGGPNTLNAWRSGAQKFIASV